MALIEVSIDARVAPAAYDTLNVPVPRRTDRVPALSDVAALLLKVLVTAPEANEMAE